MKSDKFRKRGLLDFSFQESGTKGIIEVHTNQDDPDQDKKRYLLPPVCIDIERFD